MNKVQKNLMLFLGAILLLTGLLICCAGPGPAVPVSIPAELPSAIPDTLQYPDSVQIDVSQISPPTGVTRVLKLFKSLLAYISPVWESLALAAVAVGENIQPIIFDSALQAQEADRIVVQVLQPLHDLGDIPVRRPVKNFRGVSVANIPNAGPVLVEIKIDFANFGSNACSGCTCPLGCDQECPATVTDLSQLQPVCFRIWVRDANLHPPSDPAGWERLTSGSFQGDALPTEKEGEAPNRGAGNLKGITVEKALVRAGRSGGGPVEPRTPHQFGHKVIYDHKISLDKNTDYFTGDTGFVEFSSMQILNGSTSHVQVFQKGPDDSAQKTLNFSRSDFGPPSLRAPPDASRGKCDQELVSRWKEDHDLWSGSKTTEETGGPGFCFPNDPLLIGAPTAVEKNNFTGVCALISTGEVIDNDPSDGSPCRDLGIDVTAPPPPEPTLQFIPFVGGNELTETDLFHPEDPTFFPEQPTF